jgi:hypothetical protein
VRKLAALAFKRQIVHNPSEVCRAAGMRLRLNCEFRTLRLMSDALMGQRIVSTSLTRLE